MELKKVFAAIAAGMAAATAFPSPEIAGGATPVAVADAKIGGFWHDNVRRLVCRWIPHCIKELEAGGRGEEFLNLVATGETLAGKEPSVKFKGQPWSDAYVYNTIEAICLALEIDPCGDDVLARGQTYLHDKMEEWIPVILAAQEPSGYIHSYHDLRKKPHFTQAGDHEFYVMGYFIEMGVAHLRTTKGRDRRLFDAAIKCADHLDSVFGPAPKRTWLNGHAGLEYALCRLADAVDATDGAGKGAKYARLASHFIRNQYKAEGANAGWHAAYHQADMPAQDMKDASGHAVRATYFYTAMSALALRLGDGELGAAADRLWESAIDRKEYITGGVGAGWHGEAFMGDYELANNGYCESCASCGMGFWADEQRRRGRPAKPSAVFERLLYNNLLGSISEDGRSFYYQNPLDSDKVRYPWHVCPCCVGNIPRAMLALKDRTYSVSADGTTLFVEQFVSLDGAKAKTAGGVVAIRQTTAYPWEGTAELVLGPEKPTRFILALRVPDRTESPLYSAMPDVSGQFEATVNGKAAGAVLQDGYACIDREWKPGDKVVFSFPMPVQRIRTDIRVKADKGCVAFSRGPVVYNFEQIDTKEPLDKIEIDPAADFKTFWMPDLHDGVTALRCGELVAIPNFARLNRGQCRSVVWMREKQGGSGSSDQNGK